MLDALTSTISHGPHKNGRDWSGWIGAPRAIPQKRDGDTFAVPTRDGTHFLVCEADLYLISDYSWSVTSRGYAGTIRRRKHIFAHQLILGKKDGLVCDHINGNKLDNRRCNLRHVTIRQNTCNAKPHGRSSRFKGVSWSKKSSKWQSLIQSNGKLKWLGSFVNELDAAIAWDEAAKRIQGEFSRLNFPTT